MTAIGGGGGMVQMGGPKAISGPLAKKQPDRQQQKNPLEGLKIKPMAMSMGAPGGLGGLKG